MTFRIGQKVVCIVGPAGWQTIDENQPVHGQVYTVRETRLGKAGQYIRLVEIVNSPGHYAEGIEECFFWWRGFRPVVTRKTDISIFTKLLTPTEPERVRNTRELCGND